jgi:DNA/RNA-binding domain of Phe-tRNA-synthetase-like protein
VNFTTAPELDAIVRAATVTVDGLTVRSPEPKLDESIAFAVATIRGWAEVPAMTDLVRTMYKKVGLDPTKTRPSSEALLRRIRRGDPFPRINGVVDVINWTSVETQLSFGVYDLDKIQGDVALRLGREGEEYAGIRKDTSMSPAALRSSTTPVLLGTRPRIPLGRWSRPPPRACWSSSSRRRRPRKRAKAPQS